MNIMEQVKALESGKGIQYILDSAHMIFSNPIYMVDAYYNLIAFSDNPDADHFWNEVITTGTFHTRSLDLIKSEDVLTVITASKKSVLIKYDKWKHARMTGHIFNRHNNWVGQTTMYEHVPFDKERTAAFEMLADKISAEIYDYEYFIKLPTAFHNDTINKFLDKTVENTIASIPHTQVMYHGFEKYFYVAVVRVPRIGILENIHQNRLAYFRSLLKTRHEAFKYAIYSDDIVMLMSSKEKNFDGETFFAPDNILLEENGLYMGISSSFENILEMRNYYDQAAAALKNGIGKNNGQRVLVCKN